MTESTANLIDIRIVMNNLMEYYRGQPEQQFRLFHMTEKELRKLYLEMTGVKAIETDGN